MAAKLVVTFGASPQTQYALNPSRAYVIGRDERCDIVIPNDTKASRAHAVLEADGKSRWLIRDQDSRNGTVVNHQPIVIHRLADGDIIRIGRSTFEFHE
jgi:pSer/pThr/pTyr-binding forkhead associated (FHA) protein